MKNAEENVRAQQKVMLKYEFKMINTTIVDILDDNSPDHIEILINVLKNHFPKHLNDTLK